MLLRFRFWPCRSTAFRGRGGLCPLGCGGSGEIGWTRGSSAQILKAFENGINAHRIACFDGLQEDRVNRNQGAESTLAFLLSLAEMNMLESSLAAFRQAR